MTWRITWKIIIVFVQFICSPDTECWHVRKVFQSCCCQSNFRFFCRNWWIFIPAAHGQKVILQRPLDVGLNSIFRGYSRDSCSVSIYPCSGNADQPKEYVCCNPITKAWVKLDVPWWTWTPLLPVLLHLKPGSVGLFWQNQPDHLHLF